MLEDTGNIALGPPCLGSGPPTSALLGLLREDGTQKTAHDAGCQVFLRQEIQWELDQEAYELRF